MVDEVDRFSKTDTDTNRGSNNSENLFPRLVVFCLLLSSSVSHIFTESYFSYLLSYYQKMCEEEKDKVTKNQSFLCAVFGGLSLPNTHIFPDNKRYEEVDGVRKEKERLTTDHQLSPIRIHFLPLGFSPPSAAYFL